MIILTFALKIAWKISSHIIKPEMLKIYIMALEQTGILNTNFTLRKSLVYIILYYYSDKGY